VSGIRREEMIGGQRLILGDCLEVLPTLAAGSVDAVITDPPYCSGGFLEAQKNTPAQGISSAAVQHEGFEWFAADNMTTCGLQFLLRTVLVHARRFLTENRSAFVCCDWRMVPNLAPCLESSGLRYRNMIVWDKGAPGLGCGFRPCHEIILEFTNGMTEYQAKDCSNLISHRRVPAGQKEHGAQKPVGLMAELVRASCPMGGLVVDPFLGSGTTLVACEQLDRRGIGIELDERYFDAACRRVEAAAKQPPLLRA